MYSFVNQHIKLDDDGGPDVGVNGGTEVRLLVNPISDPLLSPLFLFSIFSKKVRSVYGMKIRDKFEFSLKFYCNQI